MRKTLSRFICRTMRLRALVLMTGALALAAPAMFAALGTSARSRAAKPEQSTAVIRTDRASYLAGDIVTISGSGFAPLESVMLQVKHADGTTESGMGHEAQWVYPSADGTFQATWTISISDSAGSKFAVTANGSSGDSAQANFARTASIALNAFAPHVEGKAVVVARGFLPNELVSVQVAAGTAQTVHVDENGRATLEVDLAQSSESVSLSAESVETGLSVVADVLPADFNSNGWFSLVDSVTGKDGVTCASPGCIEDVPLQNDLTRMGRNDNSPTKYKVFWSWTSVTSWTGTGQTGNACALFDSDGNSKINFAVCAIVQNDPTDPTKVIQVAGSPSAYLCGDTKNDRCAQPTPATIVNGSVVAGVFGTLAAGNLVTPTDPFPTSQWAPNDTTIEVDILKAGEQGSILPSGSDLVNVCSYPSNGNGANNNPFDCIVRPASGFLQIVKNAAGSQTFTFDVKKGNNNPTDVSLGLTITPSGGTGTLQSALALDLATDYSVAERSITGWQLDSKSCAIAGSQGTTGSALAASAGPPATFGGVSAITIASGKITTCTFNDSQVQPKLTLIKNVINDNGGTATATDWTLTATGTGGFTDKALSTITVESGYSSSASTGKQSVNVSVQYALSESSTPSGYGNGVNSWSCSGGGTFVSPNKITLVAGEDVTCRIVNDDIAPKLTLIKNVKNDNGRTEVATAWTLAASGTTGGFSLTALNAITTETGFSSSASTGEKAVRAGVQYTLSESAAPSGYTASNWTCDGGTFNGTDKVTLALNASVTCRITNDDNAADVTLKTVQKWVIHDRVQIDGYNDPGVGNRGTVTFELYDTNCSAKLGDETVTVTVNQSVAGASMTTGVQVTSAGTYKWKVIFNGDQNNAGKTKSCGGEVTTITKTDDAPL